MIGQDLEEGGDGKFRIARRVAKDRIISTVDVEARHGHKTSARGFDGYKGHVAVDPDSEIITDTTVTAGNAGDASVAQELVEDLVIDRPAQDVPAGDELGEPIPATGRKTGGGGGGGGGRRKKKATVQAARARRAEAREATRRARLKRRGANQPAPQARSARPTVYGDAAYGTGEFLDHLATKGIESRCKTQPPTAAGGLFAKDRFDINLDDDTVTCPNQVKVTIRRGHDGDGIAYFADACAGCPLRAHCTNAEGGRSIRVGRHEQRLADARDQQHDPDWVDDYRATRPKIERKLGHMMRRRHGGRRARVRGKRKVNADFNLLAAAQNLARLAVLGLRSTKTGWAVTA